MFEEKSRIESEVEVRSYLRNLEYALAKGATLIFQKDRLIDQNRDPCFTNGFTVADLFPNENPIVVLKKELQNLTVEEYIATVKDLRFPNRSEMREFGKIYHGNKNVYIKIRVDLLSELGNHKIFVMSFHYSEIPFHLERFPHKIRRSDNHEND